MHLSPACDFLTTSVYAGYRKPHNPPGIPSAARKHRRQKKNASIRFGLRRLVPERRGAVGRKNAAEVETARGLFCFGPVSAPHHTHFAHNSIASLNEVLQQGALVRRLQTRDGTDLASTIPERRFFSHVERALDAQHFAGINFLPLNSCGKCSR